MCRNKKIVMLLGLVMTISLSGCSLGNFFTDTGSGKQQDIEPEDYLNRDVLSDTKEQTVENLYKVYTLTTGDFEEEAAKQILKRSYINVPTIRLSLGDNNVQFGEYIASYMQYVEVGDVIATVHTDINQVAVEEARIRLNRLEERYQAAEVQMQEDLQDILDEKALIYNDYKRSIMKIHYEQRQLDWESEKYNYECQIKDAREKLDELTRVGSVYEVTATRAGTVIYINRYPAGSELKDGSYICHILDDTEVYTTTDLQADQFCYGMEVTFDNRNGLTPAKVISGGSWGLYGNLDTNQAIFQLDFEEQPSELDQTGLNNLVLKGNLRTMNQVVLVPKEAVTVEEDEYFVTVLRDDGTLLKTEFIPGGSNQESYWVFDGLSEGMRIVYN